MLSNELKKQLEDEQLSLMNALSTVDQDSKEYAIVLKRIADIQDMLEKDDKLNNETEKTKVKEPKWIGIVGKIVIPLISTLIPAGIGIAKICSYNRAVDVAAAVEDTSVLSSRTATKVLLDERVKKLD